MPFPIVPWIAVVVTDYLPLLEHTAPDSGSEPDPCAPLVVFTAKKCSPLRGSLYRAPRPRRTTPSTGKLPCFESLHVEARIASVRSVPRPLRAGVLPVLAGVQDDIQPSEGRDRMQSVSWLGLPGG